MRLFLAALATFMITSTTSHAQASYQQAKDLLEEASQKIKSYQAIRIDFSYEFANTRVDPPVTQEQQGRITIQGDNYRLTMDKMKQLRHGNKLYNILDQDQEIQVTEYDPEEDEGMTPSKLLNLFDEGYSYKMGGEAQEDGQTIQYVILKPKASESIDKIMVGIAQESGLVQSMKQWGTNGTVTTLRVKSIKPMPDLAEDYFEFDRSQYSDYYFAE